MSSLKLSVSPVSGQEVTYFFCIQFYFNLLQGGKGVSVSAGTEICPAAPTPQRLSGGEKYDPEPEPKLDPGGSNKE